MRDASLTRLAMASLPAPATGIVGREGEIAHALALLRRQDVRLVTLTGPGGAGKTRLALEIARRVASAYPDGVAFVPIASVTDPALVLPAIAAGLGLAGGMADAAALAAEIGDRDILIVVDNFEQVDAAAPLLAGLLGAAPGAQVLVTSRTLLRIAGEHHLPVAPLPLPPARPLPLAELAANPAVQLFVARADAATGNFALSEANAGDVALTCARLEGLPLAIELAAARLRHLSLPALAARLDRRLDVLVDGPRDAPARLRTLRDAIAWSYGLLTPAEQTLFRRLGVFAGSFSLEAVQQIANHDHAAGEDALASLAALVDSSLVQRLDLGTPAPRYGMLETIREFALEHLTATEDHATTGEQHGAHFLGLAEEANRAMETPEQGTWALRLLADQENLRLAIQRAIALGQRERALLLSMALWAYWSSHAYLAEGRRWLEQAIAMPGDAPRSLVVRAVHVVGNLALSLFELDAAGRYYAQARSLWQESGSAEDIALGDLGLGAVTRYRGEYAASEGHYLAVHAVWALADDAGDMAIIEHALGAMYADSGQLERAVARHDRALRYRRQAGEPFGLGYTLASAAISARWAGDRAAALAAASEARLVFERLENPESATLPVLVLALLAADAGRDDEARALLRTVFAAMRENPGAKVVSEALEGLAGVLLRQSDAASGARLLAAATGLRTARGLAVPVPERANIADLRAAAAEALGVTAFSAAWSAGLRLTLDQAVDDALLVIDAPQQGAGARVRYDLTRRESEVLALLAEHLSDREIADRLYLSPRTIERHVANILLKLETPNRRLASALAVREGLVAAT
ncbi:MAG: LuxR C-terminal-related transcriptional regulator [Thermomicrobiales bacterium]